MLYIVHHMAGVERDGKTEGGGTEVEVEILIVGVEEMVLQKDDQGISDCQGGRTVETSAVGRGLQEPLEDIQREMVLEKP